MDYILAFSAGLLSFLSPCILPLIPAYLSYLAGSAVTELNTNKSKLQLLKQASLFVLGFSIVFITMGLTVSSISQIFTSNLSILKKIGGVLVFVFGLHMTGLIRIRALYHEKSFMPNAGLGWRIAPIFLGMAFALGWTPCVGPILSSILIYAGSMATVLKGTVLLSVYSLGLAVPFLLSALAVSHFADYFKKLKKYLPVVSIISGAVLMIMGILIFTDRLSIFNRYFNAVNF